MITVFFNQAPRELCYSECVSRTNEFLKCPSPCVCMRVCVGWEAPAVLFSENVLVLCLTVRLL